MADSTPTDDSAADPIAQARAKVTQQIIDLHNLSEEPRHEQRMMKTIASLAAYASALETELAVVRREGEATANALSRLCCRFNAFSGQEP